MANETPDLEIILRRHGRLWRWTLNKDGKTHVGPRAELTEDYAVVQAMVFARQLDLSAHFKKQKDEAAKAELQ